MSLLVVVLIIFNAVLFSALGIRAAILGRRAESPYLRALAWVVSGASLSFVLGAIQRLAVQAALAGWIPEVGITSVATGWQLLQSLAALTIGVAAFWILTRAWAPIGLAEQVASTLAGRLPQVDLDRCGLTGREREVVEVIGSGLLSDREIADRLFISPATAATHVKRILRKTGLTSRRDLLLLFLAKDL